MSPGRSRDVVAGTALVVVLFAVFYASPVHTVTDSKYSMLLAEQLLLEQRFELDRYFWPQVDSSAYPKVKPGAYWPRHVQPDGVRRFRGDPEGKSLYYVYPHGSSVLSVPAVALMRLVGVSTILPDGRYDYDGEKLIQKVQAAALMALAGAIFFATARVYLPVGWSLLIAALGCLGSNVWSTASRAMWAHTWDVVLLALALLLLTRAEEDAARLHPVLLGTVLSWGFFVRPTAAFFIAPLAVFVVIRHFRKAWWMVATGAVWLLLFFAYSRHHFGSWLPPYYGDDNGFKIGNLFLGIASNLLAPSRGLLVYSPVMLLVVYLLIAYRRHLRARALLLTTAAVFAIHLFFVSCTVHWWSNGYGQRFLTDLVPIFVLWGIAGTAAARAARVHDGTEARPGRWRRRLEIAALVLFGCWSVAIHGAGAASRAARDWNYTPKPITRDPMRVFRWDHPQWWCALTDPDLLAAVMGDRPIDDEDDDE